LICLIKICSIAFVVSDGDEEETNFWYDGHIDSLEIIWNWLRDDLFPLGFEEQEEIEMFVEDPNEVFYFRCAVVRERSESGRILHDGFNTFSWCFSPNQTKPTFDEQIQEMFPFIDSPTNMIFIGMFLNCNLYIQGAQILFKFNLIADHNGTENTFLSTDIARFGGYQISNWLSKHFVPNKEEIKMYIELPVLVQINNNNEIRHISAVEDMRQIKELVIHSQMSSILYSCKWNRLQK